MSVRIRVDQRGLQKYSSRIKELLDQVTDLEPFMREASQYMIHSTQTRITRDHRSPSGVDWAPLSDLTIMLKGHNRPLFQTGFLSRSIHTSKATDKGFVVKTDAPYAGWMQKGVKRTSGRYRGTIPPRPFAGFSQTNIRRLSQMLRRHILETGEIE